MSLQSFELPTDFDGQARLFPLSDLVMFPNNLLPLHIFESRYCEMLEDATRGDQLIAMATLMPGFEDEYYTRAPIAPVVCIGRVTDYDKTAQGTYNLMLLGLRRAEVENEIEPVRSFRRAQVKLLDGPELESGQAAQQIGQQLADRLQILLPSAKKLVKHFFDGELSLASLTDVMAFHLPLPTQLKLELLAERNVRARANTLLANLPGSKSPKPKSNRFPTDFSNN